MNLSKIKALCGGGKHAVVYNDIYGCQWISCGAGAYLVEGVKINDDEALKSLWNLSPKARAKAYIGFENTDDPRFTRGTYPDEEMLNELGAVVMAGDEAGYIALESPTRGTLFVDAALFTPTRSDYRRCFARWRDGVPIIAVYDDLDTCVALLLTVANVTADCLHDAAVMLSRPVYHMPDAEERAAEAEAAAEAMFKGEDDGEEDERDE